MTKKKITKKKVAKCKNPRRSKRKIKKKVTKRKISKRKNNNPSKALLRKNVSDWMKRKAYKYELPFDLAMDAHEKFDIPYEFRGEDLALREWVDKLAHKHLGWEW